MAGPQIGFARLSLLSPSPPNAASNKLLPLCRNFHLSQHQTSTCTPWEEFPFLAYRVSTAPPTGRATSGQQYTHRIANSCSQIGGSRLAGCRGGRGRSDYTEGGQGTLGHARGGSSLTFEEDNLVVTGTLIYRVHTVQVQRQAPPEAMHLSRLKGHQVPVPG